MKALEFKSKIKNNKIQIPRELQEEFSAQNEKNVKVIVLYEDDEESISNTVAEQFLKGYAESDSIYDE